MKTPNTPILRVNEIFTTFQGEGVSIGRPVTFLRLAMCNLQCRWCDTWYTWNFGKGDGAEERFGSKTVKRENEVHHMYVEDVAKKLLELKTKNLVISGGEPMIQQEQLIALFDVIRDTWPYYPHIEVETNGTLPLINDFDAWINQINCSPKLASSGNALAARLKPSVLRAYKETDKAFFKFVITNEDDVAEVLDMREAIGIPHERIYLMPQGKTKAEQEAWQGRVAQIAQENGFNFSPRLHILLYDSQRAI